MENSSGHGRPSHPHSSFKQKRSGYEPSDTETDWQDSPWHDLKSDNRQRSGALVIDLKKVGSDLARNTSPLSRSQRYSSNLDHDRSSPVNSSKTGPIPRRNSISPYKTYKEETSIEKTSPIPKRNGKSTYKTRTEETSIERHKVAIMRSEMRRNTRNLAVSERRRQISPYRTRKEEPDPENYEAKSSIRRNTSPHSNGRNERSPYKDLNYQENRADRELLEASRVSARLNVSSRSVSAQRASEKTAAWQKDQQISMGVEKRGAQSPTPKARSQTRNQSENEFRVDSRSKFPSAVDITERIAKAKLSIQLSNALLSQSTESISPGDIFFSRDCALSTAVTVKSRAFENSFAPKETPIPGRNTAVQPSSRGVITRAASNTSSGSVFSRQSSKTSTESSKTSDVSGEKSRSSRKFAAERQRWQSDAWFACVRRGRGTCRNSKSPEPRPFDEASYIEKAFVMENLRQFWADEHRPVSLGGFICHKQQAQHLKQLISHNNCPHILFKGPSGSGKKALSMDLLHEIYGDTVGEVSHGIRYFNIQETRSTQVAVPITSSPHHMELDLKSEPKNGRYVLMTLIKEIISNSSPTPEVSDASLRADYKVIVLYEVDKLADNIQHLIKWVMDCYTDACKIILCCEDDTDLESIKSRCSIITVDAPVIHKIIEVLIQIARKENFDLSVSFAAKIATKSKQNLRKAIMALEACKAHNYPFLNEQPIPLGWEEVLVDLAAEILADPSPKRLAPP